MGSVVEGARYSMSVCGAGITHRVHDAAAHPHRRPHSRRLHQAAAAVVKLLERRLAGMWCL